MKPVRSQIQFLGGVLVWTVLLQGLMLWQATQNHFFVCNGGGAWPFSAFPLLGSGILTLVLATGLCWWAWRSLRIQPNTRREAIYRIGAWALVVASGLSHALERLTSNCVLDYWRLSSFGHALHFNLGDVSLTAGALALMGFWLREYKRKQ